MGKARAKSMMYTDPDFLKWKRERKNEASAKTIRTIPNPLDKYKPKRDPNFKPYKLVPEAGADLQKPAHPLFKGNQMKSWGYNGNHQEALAKAEEIYKRIFPGRKILPSTKPIDVFRDAPPPGTSPTLDFKAMLDVLHRKK